LHSPFAISLAEVDSCHKQPRQTPGTRSTGELKSIKSLKSRKHPRNLFALIALFAHIFLRKTGSRVNSCAEEAYLGTERLIVPVRMNQPALNILIS
jgi:hypothetical protein